MGRTLPLSAAAEEQKGDQAACQSAQGQAGEQQLVLVKEQPVGHPAGRTPLQCVEGKEQGEGRAGSRSDPAQGPGPLPVLYPRQSSQSLFAEEPPGGLFEERERAEAVWQPQLIQAARTEALMEVDQSALEEAGESVLYHQTPQGAAS